MPHEDKDDDAHRNSRRLFEEEQTARTNQYIKQMRIAAGKRRITGLNIAESYYRPIGSCYRIFVVFADATTFLFTNIEAHKLSEIVAALTEDMQN